MKYAKTVIIAVIICFVFSACGILGIRQTNYFGFSIYEFNLVEEEDTHGGFHGDGSYYLILDCSEKPEQAQALIKDWKPLPLTENLQHVMYCGGYDFAKEAHWPAAISNGVYKFVDRHYQAVDKSDDKDLLSRFSFNFSIAVYDLDANMLYYFEMDT